MLRIHHLFVWHEVQITKISNDTEAANGRSMALQYLEAGKNRKMNKVGKKELTALWKLYVGQAKKIQYLLIQYLTLL